MYGAASQSGDTPMRSITRLSHFCRQLLLGTIVFALVSGLPARAAGQTPAITTPDSPLAVTEGILPEPHFIDRGIRIATKTIGEGSGELKDGFYPELSNMVTGAGWISAGPGYRRWLFGDRAIVDASAAISWRSYKMAQTRFELTKLAHSRLAVGSQIFWQDLTQVTYFGEGAGSLESDRSEYRMKSTDVVGYTNVRPTQWLTVGGRIGWMDRPSLLSPAGTFKRGNPATQEVFAENVAFSRQEQPAYLHGDLSITSDTRDSRSHPTGGGVYRAAWATYSDRDGGAFSFRRYEAEAAQFVPLAEGRLVLAMHGWLVGTDTTSDQTAPFYLMPSLGGHNTLRGYSDYRFHDRNLLVFNAESRLALFTHVDLAAFVDAGNVAPRIGDLNVDKRDYGLGLRMHSMRATFARIDVAHGEDGWRFFFRTGDPLHLSRLARRVATAPFAP